MTTPVYSDPMMRGQSYVRNTIGNYLQSAMPTYIDALRSQYTDLDAAHLPYPVQYLCEDPYDSSQNTYPIVGAYFTNDSGYSALNYVVGNGSIEYDITYSAVLFVTVTTPYLGQDKDNLPMYGSRADTIKLRDDMVNALRVAVLAKPSFGTAALNNRIVADISSIRGTYPEPMTMGQNATGRWLCSGLLTMNVDATERVSNVKVGTLSQVDLTIKNADTNDIMYQDMLPFD